MGQRKLKVLALFDVPEPPPIDNDYSFYLASEDWADEADVIKTLAALGHEVIAQGLHDTLEPVLDRVRETPPDIVFNMCEVFDNRRDQEVNLVGLYELLRLPYTGSNPAAMRICRDKGLSKKLLSYHRIRIPRFEVSQLRRPKKKLSPSLLYPAICKPLDMEGSEGIARASLVRTEEEALERAHFIHEKFKSDAIVEEFIDGREIYVGILGNKRLTVFPPQELFFRKVPDPTYRFATYKAKWDNKYRHRYGIANGPARDLEQGVEERLRRIARKIYGLFQLNGYARIDFRLKDDGDIVFLEANPNPSINHTDEFACAALSAGTTYPQLIDQIVQLGLQYHKGRS